ncbi:MAG: prepilin peptidase [Gammaproteobacteria bacterium]|nr:MAG: prepilin peptidase [Gammaproteobacteria bacterium]PIE36748.1 MAG: prepilin peptidase [Gammaproteobacteria bacterium]
MTLISTIQASPALFYLIVGFVSLMVGSFLNVVIHRLPIMMERAWREGLAELDAVDGELDTVANADNGAETSTDNDAETSIETGTQANTRTDVFNLAVPRSCCPNCGHQITALENIPVLSYLVLGGKCSSCRTPISVRYPIVEFVTMLLSLIVAWQLGPTPQAVLGIIVTWFLVAMSMIDFDHQLLPDNLTLPLMWIGLLAALVPVLADLRSAVIGAAAGYLILWSIFQLFRLVTGKEGMGYGDFKLLAALGALLGWQALPMVILLSSLVGAVVGIAIIMVTGRDRNIPIPFGPYLAAAGWIAMLWGDGIMRWYQGF